MLCLVSTTLPISNQHNELFYSSDCVELLRPHLMMVVVNVLHLFARFLVRLFGRRYPLSSLELVVLCALISGSKVSGTILENRKADVVKH